MNHRSSERCNEQHRVASARKPLVCFMEDLLSSKLPPSQSNASSCCTNNGDEDDSQSRHDAALAADEKGVAYLSSPPNTMKKISTLTIVNDAALSPTEHVRRRCRKGILKKPSFSDHRRSSSYPTTTTTTTSSSATLVRWDNSIIEGRGGHFANKQVPSSSVNVQRTAATRESRWSSLDPTVVYRRAASAESITTATNTILSTRPVPLRSCHDEFGDGNGDSSTAETSYQSHTTTTFKFSNPSFLATDLHQQDEQQPVTFKGIHNLSTESQPHHSLLPSLSSFSTSSSSSSPPSSSSRLVAPNSMMMPPMKPVRRSSLDCKEGLTVADNIVAMI